MEPIGHGGMTDEPTCDAVGRAGVGRRRRWRLCRGDRAGSTRRSRRPSRRSPAASPSIVGAYKVDPQAFADGLRFFRADQFVEARAAFAARGSSGARCRRSSSTSPTRTTARAGDGSTTTTRCSRKGLVGGRQGDRAGAGRTAGRRRSGPADALGRRAARRAAARRHARRLGLQPAARVRDAEMSATREAIVLPLLFLTVTLLAAVRLGRRRRVRAAVALRAGARRRCCSATLVRGGALAPARLLHGVAADARERQRRGRAGDALRRGGAGARRCSRRAAGCRSSSSTSSCSCCCSTRWSRSRIACGCCAAWRSSSGSALVLKFVVLASLSEPGGQPHGARARRALRRRDVRHDRAGAAGVRRRATSRSSRSRCSWSGCALPRRGRLRPTALDRAAALSSQRHRACTQYAHERGEANEGAASTCSNTRMQGVHTSENHGANRQLRARTPASSG